MLSREGRDPQAAMEYALLTKRGGALRAKPQQQFGK